MRLRFILDNDIAGSQQIDNPDGWKDIKIKLERHPDFHSLVEGIEVPLIFYGRNNEVDGGYHYIKDVLDSQGFNAIISILIEIDENDDDTWDELFTGHLDLSDIEDYSEGEQFFKLKCPITQTGLWSNFINRLSTPVDIKSYRDLDGNSIDPAESITLQMLSQTIRQRIQSTDESFAFYNSNHGASPSAIGEFADNDYIQLGFLVGELLELKFKYNPLNGVTPDVPGTWIFEPEFNGTYSFDVVLPIVLEGFVSNSEYFFYDASTRIEVYFRINDTITTLTHVSNNYAITAEGDAKTLISNVFTHTQSIYLNKGDRVYVYFKVLDFEASTAPAAPNIDHRIVFIGNTDDTTDVVDRPFYNDVIPDRMRFNVVGETEYSDTTSDAFLIHDVADAIIKRICSYHVYSENLGGTIHGYDADGCNWKYVLLKGLHARGYTLAQKPFFQSFKDFWDGANPIYNLGLGYEELETSPNYHVIRIEEKEHFYQEDISLTLNNVDNIKKSFDKSHIFKSIGIGYQKWSAESEGGIDDPQTKKVYSTIFKQVGSDISLLSKFIAAALAIEQTRRNRVEQAKDWRLDDDTLIVAINPNSSPLYYEPEFDENFTSITGINNPSTRYNLRLTPAYNFLRWIQYFRGCLQKYTSTDFSFASAEGNYDFSATMDKDSDCLSVEQFEVGESDDIPVNINNGPNDFLHLPDRLEFSYKLSWSDYKTIRNNRKKAIAVSSTDSDHDTCHINVLDYSLFESKADFDVWIGGRINAVARYLFESNLTDVSPSQSFTISFYQADGLSTTNQTVTTAAGSRSNLAQCTDNDVVITVNKTTNGGLASADGTMLFKKNGVTIHTVAFDQGDDLSSINYTASGLSCGDNLRVDITETSPTRTLTVSYFAGLWTCSLDLAMNEDLLITNATALGFLNSGCSISSSETDTLVNLPIDAGDTIATQFNNDLSCTTTYFSITDSVNVNGSTVNDGDVLAIGIYQLTIQIEYLTCSEYGCSS